LRVDPGLQLPFAIRSKGNFSINFLEILLSKNFMLLRKIGVEHQKFAAIEFMKSHLFV
jgi:hypothetical protein